ncbi:MAG: recombination protein RecR [Clostridia bacterium]|nr:recombination protein RecR [Oscillospiraceae bacterium]MBQ6835416.1 recombination protein RecR [Clostridia bacterium]MBQ6867958.1 recombination protein RecR [Clostridia bacterium]MBQ6934787.1 recombination protein RecR [Clostridia bacterium]
MKYFAPPVEKLIEQFAKLPGVGHKTAQRLAFHVMSMPEDEVKDFADALLAAKSNVQMCKICQNLTQDEVCKICADESRDRHTICVVSDPKDLIAIEKTKEYNGLYHVLHGSISPLNGIGPDALKIKELLLRIADEDITEIIMATNPDTEGETTAVYLARLLRPFNIKITRLAYGIPVGGHLEFADQVTLGRAIEGRRVL